MPRSFQSKQFLQNKLISTMFFKIGFGKLEINIWKKQNNSKYIEVFI